MAQTADVIIIGAGVHGASLAFHLSQRGASVVVLEKQFIAAGATGRSSGLVRMHYDTEVDSRLAWLSFDYFRNWKELVGGTCGFTRTGFVQLVSTKYMEMLKKNVAMQHAIGIPTLLVTASDLQRLVPGMQVDDVELAAYEPESGYAMPADTANAFMDAARKMGARLVTQCQVTGIATQGGRISGVATAQGEYSAPVVVNAAGAWAGSINRLAGLELPYDTWKHDVMMVKRPASIFTHPAVIDFPNLMYFRPEGDLTLVGLEDHNPVGASPDGDADHAGKGFVEKAIDRICLRLPAMELGALHSAHSGFDGITPDQHSYIGALGPEGFFLDCGHSGTGFKTSPAAGLCLSELILDGVYKTIDLSELSPRRVLEGKALKGNYENIWS